MITDTSRGDHEIAYGFLLATAILAPRISAADFVRGDVDGNCQVQWGDASWVIAHLFLGNSDEVRCLDAADVDDSGRIDLSDAIYLLNYLFRGCPEPPVPFLAPGADSTGPPLGCDRSSACGPEVTIAGLRLGRPNGIVFVVDRSGDMGALPLDLARREVGRCVSQLGDGTWFGIAFFDAGSRVFPAPNALAPAPDAVGRALEYLDATPYGAGTCPHVGFEAALAAVRTSPPPRRDLVYLGYGAGMCQGANEERYLETALDGITASNGGTARIHTVAVGEVDGYRKEFLMDLALRNGGMHAHVTE